MGLLLVPGTLWRTFFKRKSHFGYPRLRNYQGLPKSNPSNRIDATNEVMALKPKLSNAQQCAMEQASEKGASSWLTFLLLAKYDFSLHKQAFRDALCLRFGWTPTRLPSHCPCGKLFTVGHAFSCPKGALPSDMIAFETSLHIS